MTAISRPTACLNPNLGKTALQTKSSLSPARKRLLEVMQRTNFGRIDRLEVRNGEPVFAPPPRITKDIKLGNPADNDIRSELLSSDFALKTEHIELFENLTRLGNGVVDSIEIRHGLPFRIVVEQEI